jgi:putative Mg2+ transporter-C (MgtC) family protein
MEGMDLTLEQIGFRLIAALILSAIIGLERQVHGKPAGIRTHALVGLGAAIMTICGVLIAAEYANDGSDVSVDPSRLASVVIQGIGFMGAGVIIQSRGSVKGLTSAATLWFVAALGIATGFGYWEIATLALIMALLLLIIFKKHEDEADVLERLHLEGGMLNRKNGNGKKKK